jgi:hypothetical protein
MATADFFIALAEALLDIVRPLEEALQSVEGFESLLVRYGWQTPADQAYFASIQNIFTLTTDIEAVVHEIEDIVANDKFSLDDALKALQLSVDIVQKVRALATSPPSMTLPAPLNDPNFWPSFAGDLAQDLFAEYLQVYQSTIYAPLHLLGIVDEVATPANGAAGRLDYVRNQIRWDRLGKMLSDPSTLLKDVYGWGSTFLHDSFVRRLQRVLVAFGLPASLYRPFHGLVSQYYSDSNPFLPTVHELRAPFFVDSNSSIGYADLGFALLPIPPATDKNAAPNGFLVGPYVRAAVQQAIPLGGPFTLNLHGGLDSEDPVGLEIRPDGVAVRLSISGTSIDAGIALEANPSAAWIIFGTPKTHRLELTDFRLGIDVTGPVDSPEIKLGVRTSKLTLIIQFEEGDGFLASIFGTDPQSLSVDGSLSWSSKTGLAFSGDAGITLTIPLHLNLVIVQLDTLSLRLQIVTGGEIDLVAAITGSATLGPISASVQNIGVKLQALPVPSGQKAGAFGDLDLNFRFKSPDGLGLSIDADVVSGGGFVLFDDAKGEYAGFLDIGIAEIIQVTFICILDTKLPNGTRGFSLLFIIFMQVPPIQLGFGFTLNGVGGVAGVNRTMSITGLQAGLRNHTLDYVINPPHTVADAPKVISAVNSFFPIATGRYVFGPILKVGWETFVQLTVGVILEVPDPIRLALLGIFDIALPTIEEPDTAIVKIHIDVLGTLDFGTKKLTVDGSMYDSRILEFPMLGDFALRSSWGANPSSLFTMGGFNPKFNTTGLDVPQLHRLSITIGDGDNPRISANAYLAITSNTVQFGANIEAYVSAGDFSVHGYLGFDVLIVITPPSISFEFDFAASLDVSYKGHSLAGLSVTGVFTGTSPWHIHGEATIHILCFSVSGSVDATWGQSITPAPPPEAVLPDLLPALAEPKNWSAALPDGATQAVTVSAPPPSPQTVLVHPMGTLSVREKIVPLDLPITHYKGGTPSDGSVFSISDVQLNGAPATTEPFPDYFAAGQFLNLSDADKLSKPSFEPYHAGVKIGSSNICSGADSSRDVTYDEYFIEDRKLPSRFTQPYLMPADVHIALSKQSAAFTAGARFSGLNKYQNGLATPAVTASDARYVVASTDNLSIRQDISPSEGATYFQAHAALNRHLATHPQDRGNLEVLPVHEAAP